MLNVNESYQVCFYYSLSEVLLFQCLCLNNLQTISMWIFINVRPTCLTVFFSFSNTFTLRCWFSQHFNFYITHRHPIQVCAWGEGLHTAVMVRGMLTFCLILSFISLFFGFALTFGWGVSGVYRENTILRCVRHV